MQTNAMKEGTMAIKERTEGTDKYQSKWKMMRQITE